MSRQREGGPAADPSDDSRGLQDSTAPRRLLRQLPAVLWTVDDSLRFTSTTGGGLGDLGLAPGDVEGQSIAEFFGTEDPDFLPLVMHRRAIAGETVRYDFVWQGRSYEVHLEPLRAEESAAHGAIGVAIDVTERRKVESALRESESLYRSLFSHSRDVIYITSHDGRVVEMNPAGLELFAFSQEEMRSVDVHDLYADPADRRRFQRAIQESGWVKDFETRLRTRHGSVIDALLTTTVRRDDRGEVLGYQGIIRDITDRKRFEERLRRRALHDPLTDLPNRLLFNDRIVTAVSRARRERRRMAVLFVDLDRFKVVNDGLGHAAGDRVLLEVARRIAAVLRHEDTVARFGGDEFTVLLEDTDPRQAVEIVERLLAALSPPFTVNGKSFRLSASIGIALGPTGATNPDELVRRADVAMYRAKESGGTGYHVYDPDTDGEEGRRFEREADLRRAIEAGEVTLFYQPLVSLASGRIVGVEPLARWLDPSRGLVMPAEFIPLAEETGLILPLGRSLLRRACETLVGWDRQTERGERLSLHVNLSAPQLEDPALLATVVEVMEATAIGPERLTFEVTERLAMERPDSIDGLKTLGVRVAVDDFGTGYSSLSYLKRLHVDALKIDQSFIHGLGRDARDDAIVRTIVTLGETLELEVVGEGVEEELQMERLRELGCHVAQGYYFARPLPAAELLELWRENPAW